MSELRPRTLADPALDAPDRRVLKGTALAFFAAFVWGGWMVATRLGVTGEFSAWDVTAIRFGTAGLLLLPVVLRRGLGLERLGWRGLAVLLIGAGVPYALLANAGFAFAPTRHGGALMPGVMPLWVALLSFVVLGERFDVTRRLGFALILGGVVTIVGISALTEFGRQSVGHLLFLSASFCWACFTVMMKRTGVGALHAAATVSVLSAALYLPVYVLFLSPGLASAAPGDIALQVLFQGVLTSVVSLIAYNRAIALIGPSRASVFSCLVPVLATLLAVPVLGELPGPRDVAGLALVTLGVLLATGAAGAVASAWRRRPKGPVQTPCTGRGAAPR